MGCRSVASELFLLLLSLSFPFDRDGTGMELRRPGLRNRDVPYLSRSDCSMSPQRGRLRTGTGRGMAADADGPRPVFLRDWCNRLLQRKIQAMNARSTRRNSDISHIFARKVEGQRDLTSRTLGKKVEMLKAGICR